MLGQADFYSPKDIERLREKGNRASPDDIRAGLVRYALVQENLTNGGAYLIDRWAFLLARMPGALVGLAAHDFILAHELSHKLLDEIDEAPGIRTWLAEQSLDGADIEIACDAMAIELIKTTHGIDADPGALGPILALKALQAFDIGSHARLPAGSSYEERIGRIAPDIVAGFNAGLNLARVDFLVQLCRYESFVSMEGWRALLLLYQSRRIFVVGDVPQAIDLAILGDRMISVGKRDNTLEVLNRLAAASPSILGPLADHRRSLQVHSGDDIWTFSRRYADTLRLDEPEKSWLEDPSRPIRYYDLIAWLLKSPLIAPIEWLDKDECYATAIYLAGAYAGSCEELQGGSK